IFNTTHFAQSSPLFILILMMTSLGTSGAVILDYALLAALREHQRGHNIVVAYLWALPLLVLQVAVALLLGAGVGGLAWIEGRVNNMHKELGNVIAEVLSTEE